MCENQDKIDKIERLSRENRELLIEQEHRLFSVLFNLISALKKGTERERIASIKALIYYFLPGRTATLIIGGSFVGIATIFLMQKNNELLADQNYYLQNQIYFQAKEDRERQLTEMVEILYDATKESIELSEKSKDISPEKRGFLLIPTQNAVKRSRALESYIRYASEPLIKPTRKKYETFIDLTTRWLCDNVSVFCGKYKELSIEPKSKTGRPVVDLFNALLEDVTWPDTSRVILRLSFSNLGNANLSGAQLSDANLQFANLSDAGMIKANLANAFLDDADLKNANLMGADFRGASLSDANFEGAEVENADFRGAKGLRCEQLQTAFLWKNAIFDIECN